MWPHPIACPCNCLLPSLSSRRSLKFVGCAVGYDDLVDHGRVLPMRRSPFSHAGSHRREALMPTWNCRYSGFGFSTMRVCKLRLETLHLQSKLCTPGSCGLKSIMMFLYASASQTRDSFATLHVPSGQSMLASASSAIQCSS